MLRLEIEENLFTKNTKKTLSKKCLKERVGCIHVKVYYHER